MSGRPGRRAIAALVLVLTLAPVLSPAEESAETISAPAAARAPNEIGLFGGGSVASSTLIGKWTDFDFGLLAFRYARNLWGDGTFALDWTVDAIPLALLALDRGGQPGQDNGPKEVVYGAGIAPIGLRFDYDGLGWWRPYVASSVGFLMFEERVPATGTKFNFTWDFGVGAQFFVTDEQAITLGYDFHHISNAYTGSSNPGFDSNIIYAGYSFFR